MGSSAMLLVICGAGEVGSHAAEVLDRAGHSVTVIDSDQDHLTGVEESIDVRTVLGSCTRARVLTEAVDMSTGSQVTRSPECSMM